MKEYPKTLTDAEKAAQYRKIGDRERMREAAARRDGDYAAAADHGRYALENYRRARALEFPAIQEENKQ